ncbi:MAG: hypothetical protein OEZ02_01290, partial [Anaerolineae bacterium]|nr:hypothetical protein [Anaerolineae bacterium]
YRAEKKSFSEFRRALLLREDQIIFDDLWNKAEFHIPAAEKAAHPLPIGTILVCMNLEQEKSLRGLEARNNDQERRIRQLEALQKEQERAIIYLKGELESLHQDMETRLKEFREEMLDLKYPSYVA